MATVRDLVNAALLEIVVLAEGEDSTAAQANQGLEVLNRMVDQWAAERLTIYAITRTETNITASQASYTVGSGGNINIAWPWYIQDVKYQDTSTDPDNEYPLVELTDAAWANLTLKDLTSPMPTSWYYNPTYPTGTLYLWPIPTGTTLQSVVYVPTAVTQFAALTTSVALPPGYQEFIVTNLAIRLSSSYRKTPDQLLFERAKEAKAIVKRANSQRLRDLSFDLASLGSARSSIGSYDIRTDGYVS